MTASGGARNLQTLTSERSADRFLFLALAGALAVFAITVRQPALWSYFVVSALIVGLIQWQLYVRDGLTLAGIAVLAVSARAALLGVPPVLSDDMYRYVWDGILVVDGINPYAFLPSADELAGYHGLAIFSELNSRDFYSVYPPVSQLVFAAGGLFARPDWLTGYYVIKGIIVAFECAGLVLLARVIGRRQTMLLALHPIILIAGAAQGHTDGLLVFFLGAAFVAWKGGRRILTAVLITLAGWVKLVPLLFVPLFMRRRPLAIAAAATLTSVIVAAPLYEQYVLGHVAQSLDLYVRYFEFYAGPYYGVKQLLLEWTGDDWSKQLGPAFRTAFLVVLTAGYVAHYRWRLDPWKSALWISAAYLLLTTTIHPWYFTGLLILIAVNERYSAHWQWVTLWSIGTYLLYNGGPYWSIVIIGWTGFVLLLVAVRGTRLVDALLRLRAFEKVREVQDWLMNLRPGDTVIDLGAGEGYVGDEIARRTDAVVTLADVRDAWRVDGHRRIVYDGSALPEPDDAYDTVILYHVLHHSADPQRVLSEAVRVAADRVIIVESVHAGEREKRRFEKLDRFLNSLRSGGDMEAFEDHLDMKTMTEWEEMIVQVGGTVVERRERYRPWHRQAFWLVSP